MRKLRHVFFIIICFCMLMADPAQIVPKAFAEASMNASESCIDFIKKVEGFSPQPYYDYNQYTVGYGTKCPTEKYFTYTANGIPKSEAEELLQEHIETIEDTLNKKLLKKYELTLTQYQFDALVSFSFNVGTGWMTYESSLRNAIVRNAEPNDMVYAFGLYCTAGGKYLPGLITRRLCEANIYLNGTYSKNVGEDFGYVYYDPNGGTLTYRVQGFLCEETPAPAADVARNGDVFLGWYTELTGGTEVTELSKAVNGKTLFARWQSSENNESEEIQTTSVRVTGDVVNIRKGPGTNYGVVKQVRQNTVLTVSHVTNLTAMRWGKVEDGWISLDYTNYDAVINGAKDSDSSEDDADAEEETPEETTAPAEETEPSNSQPETEMPSENNDAVWGVVRVNDLLRIRSGPGTNYTVVGFLFNDKEVEILEKITVGSMDWGRISRGWVSMNYIEISGSDVQDPVIPETEEKEPEEKAPEFSEDIPETTEITGRIKADALRIRAGAGTANPIVGFYYENDWVTVYEKKMVGAVYWGKTSKGWINMDYVVTESATEPAPKPAEGTLMTVIGDCLRVRKGTGTNYKIAALLYYGDKITVFETTDVDGVLWGKVNNGWICMDYVE